ncbi:MAG: hypothetical protein HQM04_00470 [Magnetococcales bacterium]|nr:hypothetical protein [Magnetococcales bacterium]MBF0113493.1 hypothetical protein [Magnetococcales bacterium]
MTIQDVKQQRRYQREQVLEEGTLSINRRTLTVDVLDVALHPEQNSVHGFGLICPTTLMAKKKCTLQLSTGRYSGRYECETVYCQETGFGMRVGLTVLEKVE